KYDDEQGYYRTHDVKNLNLTLTADHELASFWKIGSSIRLRRNSNSGYKTIGNDILYMTPLAKPYKENGEMDFFPNPINTSGYNPLANYLPGQFIDDTQKNIINLNLTSDIKITNWLSMHTNFGFIYNNYEKGYFYGKDSHNNKGVKNSSGKNYNKYDQYTLNHIISYDKSFGDHHLTADLVGEIQSYRYEESALSGENQPVEYTTYHNLGTNSDNIKISSGYKEWSLASGLVRVRYNYKNKYFLNGAIRADGSSRLAKGKQWAFFPSGGVGWSLKDEDFLSGTEWVSALKARFSYGTVGNTAISPYQTLSSLTQDKYLWGEGDSDKFYVYYPGSIINLDLGWEISRTINAGLDFGFLNNKLNGYIEFYNTKTSDLLMKRAIPTFTGFNEIWQNIGKTQNKGFEFNLNYAPVRTKDLNIDFTFNASRNWEKILELISGEDLPNNKWFIGEPLAVLYNYEKLGVWQYGEEEEAAKYNASVGDLKIKDQDGDGTISAAKDRVILGQERPKWIASLGANIQYKNFDFSFNINSRWGYSFNLAPFNDVVLDGQRWLPAVDYWTPDNPTNNYPKADQSNGWDTYRSANGYQKGDHIKLQDVTVGYSFDKLLSKTFIKKARFYVQLRNVAYLYKATDFGIMPEAPDMNYTIPSSYNFGVNVTF
ncbi:SusC/RagA family TonB-linked outer membrane protein, partial [Parabacteroides merdae]